MKSLTLFRHAKTEAESASGRDFDRTLTEGGQDDARRMGEEIRRLGLTYDRVLTSPATRAVQTIHAAGLQSQVPDDRIYDASASGLLEAVQSVDDHIDRVLMVGHNPGFERLASRLIGMAVEMPTGSLVEMELPADHWRDVGDGSGRLVRFLKPKELG